MRRSVEGTSTRARIPDGRGALSGIPRDGSYSAKSRTSTTRRDAGRWQRGPVGGALPGGAGDRAGAVFRQDADLMPAGELGMLGHARAAVEDAERAGAAVHFHGLADEGEGHGVAVGVDADQLVLSDDAGRRGLEAEARLARRSGAARAAPARSDRSGAHGSCHGSAGRRW